MRRMQGSGKPNSLSTAPTIGWSSYGESSTMRWKRRAKRKRIVDKPKPPLTKPSARNEMPNKRSE